MKTRTKVHGPGERVVHAALLELVAAALRSDDPSGTLEKAAKALKGPS